MLDPKMLNPLLVFTQIPVMAQGTLKILKCVFYFFQRYRSFCLNFQLLIRIFYCYYCDHDAIMANFVSKTFMVTLSKKTGSLPLPRPCISLCQLHTSHLCHRHSCRIRGSSTNSSHKPGSCLTRPETLAELSRCQFPVQQYPASSGQTSRISYKPRCLPKHCFQASEQNFSNSLFYS